MSALNTSQFGLASPHLDDAAYAVKATQMGHNKFWRDGKAKVIAGYEQRQVQDAVDVDRKRHAQRTGDDGFDTPLPGMAGMKQAEPHEQTQGQFLNRPDVMVHGRYEPKDKVGYHVPSFDFHAGTAQAAYDRLGDLGHPFEGHEARFLHGQINESAMQNTRESPIHDHGMEWDVQHLNKFYKNDVEDKGSISVILNGRGGPWGDSREVNVSKMVQDQNPAYPPMKVTTTQERPTNFRTWREAVGQAIDAGHDIPKHVMAEYSATGGAEGPQHVYHYDFKTPVGAKARSQQTQMALPPFTHGYADDHPLANYGLTAFRWHSDNDTNDRNIYEPTPGTSAGA